MNEIVVTVNAKMKYTEGKFLVYMQFSDNKVICEECDECIEYTIFSESGVELDGGEMEYNSVEKEYGSIQDAIQDVLGFAFDDAELTEVTITDLTIEEIEEM